MAALKIPGLSQAFSSAGSSTTNMIIAAAAAAITGYIGYTYFFKTQVEPTASAAAAQIEMLASTNLVSLEEQLVNAILTYAQNRDTVMNNVDRIRTAAATYRIKLEELVKERLGNRVNETQMKQQLAEMVKELSVTLEIPLRVGISPPNPGPWNFWNNHLECTGGQRFSTCQNKCLPSYQPDPYWCNHPIPPPVIFPPPRPHYPYPPRHDYPYPLPGPIPRPPIFPPWPRPHRPRRPLFRWPVRPNTRTSCHRDVIGCRLRYRSNCTSRCRHGNTLACRKCKCACQGGRGRFPGQGGHRFGNFSNNYQANVARAYTTSHGSGCNVPSLHGYDCGVAGKQVIEAQLKVAERHTDRIREACRGNSLGDKIRCKVYNTIARTWCNNAERTFNSKCSRRAPLPPPIYYPPPPPPIYHPPYHPPVPLPHPIPGPYYPPEPGPGPIVPSPYYPPAPGPIVPSPYYPPAPPPPVYYPPPPPVYYPPPTQNYPSDLTGNQIVRQSTTPIGVYAGLARARRARAMRARAYATRIRPRFSGLN